MGPKVKRRDFVKSVGLVGISLFSKVSPAKPQKKRPNILWMIAEDFSPDLGCYGNTIVHTPNIDGLARGGAIYTRAYTSAPSCCPSRSGMMTGVWQIAIGAHNQRPAIKKPLPKGVHVITKYFRDAGYFTANIRNFVQEPYGRAGTGKDDFGFQPHQHKVWDSNRWSDLQKNQPFYAQMTISNTHRSFIKPASIVEFQVDSARVKVPPFYPDVPVVRQDFADYYASTNALDVIVGKVLKRLKQDGLDENTVVLFIGDHGRPMLRGKQFLYEQGIRIPMIIRWPGHIQPGTVVNELISALDLAPTFLKLAGADVPEHMHGHVFLGPNRGKPRRYIFAARDRIDEAVDRIRCVLDKQFKYIRNYMPNMPYLQPQIYREMNYPTREPLMQMFAQKKLNKVQARFFQSNKPQEELYDLQKDPWETENLANNPKYQNELKRLRQALEMRLTEVGDKGATPEPMAEYTQIMEERALKRNRWVESGRKLPQTWQQMLR